VPDRVGISATANLTVLRDNRHRISGLGYATGRHQVAMLRIGCKATEGVNRSLVRMMGG
jgi:hypothetical protein